MKDFCTPQRDGLEFADAGPSAYDESSGPTYQSHLAKVTSSSTSGWRAWQRAKPRVVAIHAGQQGDPVSRTEYHDASLLQGHLTQRTHFNVERQCSVYILEGLSHDFITVLGSHFQLPLKIFTDHERLVALRNRVTGEGGGIPFLPSTIHHRSYVSLKYHEPLLLSTLPTSFRNLCDVSGRHLAVTRMMGKFSDVAIARRKCTVWSRKTETGGWDCLIICDPPIKRILTDYSGTTSYNVMTAPYNAAFAGFVPLTDQIKNGRSPPQMSVVDDIADCLSANTSNFDPLEPSAPRLVVEKMIANQYLKLAEFTQTTIEMVQFSLSRHQDLTSFDTSVAEQQWSDVQALERRVGEYEDDLEGVMLQLRIPIGTPNTADGAEWTDSIIDYRFLHSRFTTITQRVNKLNGSIVALAGLTNSHQAVKAQRLALEATERSIREAKSVKALTILGIVFVPLAYVASLFSMTDPYKPGGEFFWVYFAAALPLIALIMLGYHALELGYSSGGTQWSLHTMSSKVRQALNP